MTPAELRVIEAARAWHQARVDHAMPRATELCEAVEALDAERKDGPEQTITWGQVVESDHIWSDKTRKWYEVISARALESGRTRIEAKGLPKSITPESGKTVLVRRGATGQAVDCWNVVWSAQTIPSTPTAPDRDKEESEESS
jgi:hypothetical protein